MSPCFNFLNLGLRRGTPTIIYVGMQFTKRTLAQRWVESRLRISYQSGCLTGTEQIRQVKDALLRLESDEAAVMPSEAVISLRSAKFHYEVLFKSRKVCTRLTLPPSVTRKTRQNQLDLVFCC